MKSNKRSDRLNYSNDNDSNCNNNSNYNDSNTTCTNNNHTTTTIDDNNYNNDSNKNNAKMIVNIIFDHVVTAMSTFAMAQFKMFSKQ